MINRTFSVASLAPADVQKVFEERAGAEGNPLERRSLKLLQLGLKFNGESYVYDDINFHWTDVTCMSDAEFNVAYEGAVRRMAVIQAALMKVRLIGW